MKSVFLIAIVAVAMIGVMVPSVFAAGYVNFDRGIYPLPTEINPLTIYVDAPGESTILVMVDGWANLQVLGETTSGVFTIYHDDYAFDLQDLGDRAEIIAEYYDVTENRTYQDYAQIEIFRDYLESTNDLYVAGDVVDLKTMNYGYNFDSKFVDSVSVNEMGIDLIYEVGTISLDDSIFSATLFIETGNNTGIFEGTITIPEKIGQYEIHYEEVILKTKDGGEFPLIITDVIASWNQEISIDVGDIVTWNSDEKYSVVTGDPDVDGANLGVLYPNGFNSGEVEGMFSHKFDAEGKYPYYDKFNPQMKGVIIVGDWSEPEVQAVDEFLDIDGKPIVQCSDDTIFVNGVCEPRPNRIETSSIPITITESNVLNTSNKPVSTATVGDTLFVGVEIGNLGSNTEDFVASYRYLASSVGSWSEWTWVSSSLNGEKTSNVAIPWNPTKADVYQFEIQVWDNVLDKTKIATEKILFTLNPVENEQIQLEESFETIVASSLVPSKTIVTSETIATSEELRWKAGFEFNPTSGFVKNSETSSLVKYSTPDGKMYGGVSSVEENKIILDRDEFLENKINEFRTECESKTFENDGYTCTYKLFDSYKKIVNDNPALVIFDDYTYVESMGTDWADSSETCMSYFITSDENLWSLYGCTILTEEEKNHTMIELAKSFAFDQIITSLESFKPLAFEERPVASFVDTSKDPQHYIDRYNNEPSYKEWFDDNYPQYPSIYDAVGLWEPTIEYTAEPTVTAQYVEEPVDELEITCGTGTIENKDGVCVAQPTVTSIPEPTTQVTSTPNCGTGTELVNGICQVVQTTTTEKSDNGGGCLIATATYGSEQAPQVQQLRELRDNQLLQTESGTAFMGTFNDIYYSFSPIVADYERENPYFKEAVKLAITPMISSLSLMENAESESEVISLGISVIMLNLGMYLGVPAVVIVGIRKRF
jgi:hypothetical protein